MAQHDLLRTAIDELYGVDPAQFVARRDALAAAAKQADDPGAAHTIGALRRPTQSAWTVNHLVRAEPGVPAELADLARALRTAERALDGARLRELTTQRRRLVDDLVRRAFAATGQRQPPSGLRDEVTATLEAALADPDVAEQVEAGTMVRAARWSGFGGQAGPALTVVTAPAPARPRGKAAESRGRATAHAKSTASTRSADRERDREQQRQRSEARDRLATAKRDHARVKQRADRLRREVEMLRRRLDEVRAELADADKGLRAAERERVAAERALNGRQSHPAR
jgi:hypothetical protein